VISFEDMYGEDTGYATVEKLMDMLVATPSTPGGESMPMVPREAWACVHNATVALRQTEMQWDNSNRDGNGPNPTDYAFTWLQLQHTRDELLRLIGTYTDATLGWDVDPVAQDLVVHLYRYLGVIEDEIDGVYPYTWWPTSAPTESPTTSPTGHPTPEVCDACPGGWTYNFDNDSLRVAVEAYTVDPAAAIATYGEINCWNTIGVTDMSGLFQDKNWFNEDISCWSTKFVTNMNMMFYRTSNFNQPLGTWDTSSLETMEDMFRVSAFNQDISGWNVGSLTSMYRTFLSSQFNQDLSAWDISNVNNMRQAFMRAENFNQNMCAWSAKATSIPDPYQTNHMFTDSGCPIQVQQVDLTATPADPMCRRCDCDACPSGWTSTLDDASIRTAVGAHLTDAAAATATYGTMNCWDTTAVTDMSALFSGAGNFNEDISCWNTKSVTDMNNMFYRAGRFDQPLGNWITSSVQDMSDMLRGSKFNQDISGWNVSSVTNMFRTFTSSEFNQDISGWDVSNVVDMRQTFQRAASFNQNMCAWGPKAVSIPDAYQTNIMFSETACPVPVDQVEMTADPPQPLCVRCDCDACLEGWTATLDDASIRTAVAAWTADAAAATATYGAMTCWNTDAVTDMSFLFSGNGFFNEDISCWNTQSVTNMNSMFYRAGRFNQPLGTWDTGLVQDIGDMFRGTAFNQDISGWNVGSVTNMFRTFLSSEFNQDVSGWDVSSVVDMRQTFQRAASFNQNLCAWGEKVGSLASNYMTNHMFGDTSCRVIQQQVDLEAGPPGPFCAQCGNMW